MVSKIMIITEFELRCPLNSMSGYHRKFHTNYSTQHWKKSYSPSGRGTSWWLSNAMVTLHGMLLAWWYTDLYSSWVWNPSVIVSEFCNFHKRWCIWFILFNFNFNLHFILEFELIWTIYLVLEGKEFWLTIFLNYPIYRTLI